MAELEITGRRVVLPVRIDPTGARGPTRGQARGRAWRRVADGWYVAADTDSTADEQRIVEAMTGRPAGTAVTGWAALAWERTRWFGGARTDGSLLAVPVALGDRRSAARRAGVVTSNDWLFDDDVIVVDGLSLTRAERSVSYEVRRARTLERAVQIIDMAAAGDRVDLESLAGHAARLAGRPGVSRLVRAIPLADENAWSPMEVVMRLHWASRHPRPLANRPLFDRTERHVVTPDLFDPVAGVAGEYNGAVHDGQCMRRRDLNREELYRDHGIEVVTMMSTDLRDLRDFERRLEAAYRRASQRACPESWTLDQPDWWVDTSTVAKRRALDEQQRSIWLRRLAA